jgi:predicted Zn finger-like uncharacterized protein
MKIVCEACQAKYSISDDKVRGKAFKIRCKKCSHTIVVRAPDGGSGASPLPIADSAAVPLAAATEHSWHIVVDGEQVGPLSASDIRARQARGEITGDTYIWREGMADWLKLSTVSDFAESGQVNDPSSPFPPQPASSYPSAAAASAFAASPDGDGDMLAPTTVGANALTADLFASPMSPPSAEPASTPASSSFSFGSNAAAAHESGSGLRSNGAGGGGSAGLTGQRHENSVLFSLSNLESLAGQSGHGGGGAAPRPGVSAPTEGSGLIDIRSMAAMTMGNAGENRQGNDLPTFGAPQFSPVAPVLLPLAHSSGPPRWLYAALAVLVMLGGGMAIVMFRLVNARPPAAPVVEPPPVAAAPPAVIPAPPAPPVQAATPPTTPPPSSTERLPPREEKAAAPAASRAPHGKYSRRSNRAAADSPAPAERAPAAAAPAVVAEKPAPKGDRLDDLLNSALGNKPKPAPSSARPREDEEPASRKPTSALATMQREDLVRAMQGVTPRVRDCFSQYKVPGTAMVKVNVARGGKVSSTAVSGKFGGTPTGMCVESAVRGAHFPPVEPYVFDFPFALH